MSKRTTIPFVAFTVLFANSPLLAQKAVEHDTEKVSVTLPTGWELGKAKPKRIALGKERKLYRILSFVAVPADSTRGVNIDVDVINDGVFEIRPSVLRDQVFYQSYQGVEKCDFGDKPLLHIVAHQTKPSNVVLAATYRRATGRTMRLMVRCGGTMWDEIEPAFFEMANSMKFDLAPWPERPSGRIEKSKDGILFSAAPSVKRAMRDVQKCAADIQKGMVEIHGAVTRPKGDPLVIYINELMADHKRIAESQKVAPVVMEPGHHRLFTVPLEERGSEQRLAFAAGVCTAILAEIYGLTDTLWFELGERWVAEQRDSTKKKLPSVDKRMAGKIQPAMTFEELTSHKKVPSVEYPRECFVYVGMFHAGPKEYRKAYTAFLAELKATGDADAATKKHLLSLDQVKMKADARAFVKKMRGVKVK